jgi:hypothetical protein
MLGEVNGRLFQRRLNPPRLYEFEDDFFALLEKVQAEGSEIGDEIDVREVYGILRTVRKGNTAHHSLNMGIDRELLKTYNRWRKSLNADGRLPRLDMVNTYADWDAIKPTLLSLTQAFKALWGSIPQKLAVTKEGRGRGLRASMMEARLVKKLIRSSINGNRPR